MNNLQLEMMPKVKPSNREVFLHFRNKLKNPMHWEDNHLVVSVRLTCYRKERLDQYNGMILLIDTGHGMGNVRILEGEQSLLNESIYHVLESKERRYSLGRSESELIIDCEPLNAQGIHRIDIEEKSNSLPSGNK